MSSQQPPPHQQQENTNQQPNAPDQAQQMAGQQMLSMGALGQAQQQHALLEQQKNALGMGMGLQQNPALANATPEQLQAMAALQQQQQAQMNSYLQQLQQMQALQQLQQQNLAAGLQGLQGNLPLSGNDQQLQAQNLLQQQQQLQQQQLLQQQAALLQQYNPLLSMSAPQGLLPQGFGSLTPQQMQGLLPQQFGQTTPQLTINGMPNQFGQQMKGPSDQQNILNINITPQHVGPGGAQRQDDKPRKADYMMMEDGQPKQTDIESHQMMEDARHRSPIDIKKDAQMNRDLSAPKQSSMHPKLNGINFQDKQNQRRAQSKVRGPEDPDKKDSNSQQRKKSKSRKTFVQYNLAKETAASQRKLGGKTSVRQQIKKQIQHLGQLEEAIKQKQKRTASQSRSPPRVDGVPMMPQDIAGGAQFPLAQQPMQPMNPLQQQQFMMNQYLGQQQQPGAYPNLLQPGFMPTMQGPVDPNVSPRRFTFEQNMAQIDAQRQQYPSLQQMSTPDLPREVLEQPKQVEQPPAQPGQQQQQRPERYVSRESEDINRATLGKGMIGQTDIFDNRLINEATSPELKNTMPSSQQKQIEMKVPTTNTGKSSKQNSHRSRAEQRALVDRLSQPKEVVEPTQVKEEGVFTPPKQSEMKQATPPRSRKGEQSSQRASKPHSKKPSSNVNVQQINVQPEIDTEAIEQMLQKQEEEDIEADLQQDSVDRKIMNQQEVDDLINAEEEYMNTMKAGDDLNQMTAPNKEDSKQAEDLYMQEAQQLEQNSVKQLKSQNSMTSSKKRKIKVSNEQMMMLSSAKSFWSKKKTPEEQPSQNLDQMIADVNDIAPDVPLPKPDPSEKEASLTQLENDFKKTLNPQKPQPNQFIPNQNSGPFEAAAITGEEPTVPILSQEDPAKSRKSKPHEDAAAAPLYEEPLETLVQEQQSVIINATPKGTVKSNSQIAMSQKAGSLHKRNPSQMTAQNANLSQMDMDGLDQNNKSAFIPKSSTQTIQPPRQSSSKLVISEPQMSQQSQPKSLPKQPQPPQSQQKSQKSLQQKSQKSLNASQKEIVTEIEPTVVLSQKPADEPQLKTSVVAPPPKPEESLKDKKSIIESQKPVPETVAPPVIQDEPHPTTQDGEPPAMEPETIINLCDTVCLPAFEMIVKTKQELIAIEVDSDSEKEDTDGYLSEEIDIKKSQIGIFNNSHLQPQKIDLEKTEGKSNRDRKTSNAGSEKSGKKPTKEKKEKDKASEKSNDPPDKKPEPPIIREQYESLSHEEIKQTMYLSQRGLLYQVRGLQQKKGHQFLIQNSKNNLYEYLQEYKEEVVIDKSGIFEINHPKKIYFEIFVIILAIYNCFGIPLEICFQPVTMEATEFVVLNSVIDFIFGVDIYVQFKTTFYDPLSGDEVFDKKVIFWTYLKGRFIVDFMATVPFDNITYAITRQRISILPLFSLLKLIRITRLGRIIERMNVREHIKLMMKLSQIIFMLIMFIHCQACAWFYIVSLTKDWTAPLDGIDPNNDLYNDTTVRKYLISVYYSILLLTCNDITPKGQWKIFFCASAVTLGAIINSIIFGNMALIIQNLNQKNSEFQESIDLANTAMKNMDMPKELQQDVVAYLQYTQQSQNGQQEFEYFYGCLSPTLRNEVIQLIFKEVTEKCALFDKKKALIDFFIKSLQLMLLDPEYPLVNQGENDNRFFFIKAGECEVFVKDPINKRDTLVRLLKSGSFFGEVSLLTGQPRTASVRPKIYAMIGFFHEQKFEEMVFMFPEVRSALQRHFFNYDDINRKWQREQLKNIQFMLYLPDEILDELTISLSLDIYDENQEIFKQGQVSDKVYILSRGKIEIFLTIPEGELFLDCITEPGSVLSQISILNRMKLTYSARAKEDSEMLSISYEKLQEQRALNHMQPLNQEIEKYFEKVINPLDLQDKRTLIGFLDYQKKRPKAHGQKKMNHQQRQQILREIINRQVMICRFQYKKDNILSDLIAELKKMNMDDQQKSLNKMKELVKSIAPIIVSKLKKLVSNRIKQVHQESLKQNQSIKNIHSIIQLINDQHKSKNQSMQQNDGGKKGKGSKKGSSTQEEDMQKSDKSPNGKYGGKQSLQNIEEQEEENMGSEESVDLSQVEDEY